MSRFSPWFASIFTPAPFETWHGGHSGFFHPWLHRAWLFPGSDRDRQRPEVTPDQEFTVSIWQVGEGVELGQIEASDDTGVVSYRVLGHRLDGDRDGIPAFSIDDDGTLTISDLDDVRVGRDGKTTIAVVASDAAGNTSTPELVSVTVGADPLVPANTPFGYNIGINYESWEYGRTGYSISADLDQITQHFQLIKTYHVAAVGTSDPNTPTIDSTQAEVIDYVVGTSGVQLVMGTENSALAQGGFGSPWAAGLMTDKAYTDAWVQMVIDAFASTADAQQHLSAILLGNEIDANGPPPTDPSFSDYLTWIQTSFDNLQASLSDAGLGTIPVSTTIANYGSTNQVSVQITQYIHDNWSADWNDGSPFVLYNQYTQDGMTSTDYTPVEKYFELVQTEVPAGLEVFIGETGYSTTSGTSNPSQDQATVYQQIFSWLDGMDGQQGNGGTMVPMFPFLAFDRPTASPGIEVGFGIFGEDSNSQPTGLKPDLVSVVPSWTDDPITSQILAGEALLGTSDKDVFAIDGGTGSIDGGAGAFDMLVLDGDRDEFDFSAIRSGPWWARFSAPSAVRVESAADDSTDIEIKNVEYVHFDDQLVRVEDLVSGYHCPHHWGDFDFG